MWRLLNLTAKHAWLSFLFIAVISLFFFFQLNSLRVHVSTNDLLVRDDPESVFSNKVDNLFGHADATLVFLQSPAPLTPERTKALQVTINNIEKLAFVDHVDSLFSVPHVKTINGYLDKAPYLETVPPSEKAGDRILTLALANPFLKNTLVADDKQVIAFSITILDKFNTSDASEIVKQIDQQLVPLKAYYEKVFQVGYPYARTETTRLISNNQLTLLPLAFAALLIALLILLRNLVDIITPVLTAGLSILWTFGLMAIMEIPLSVVTSVIPVLLIVVGSTEDIHLMSEFRSAMRKGFPKKQAIKRMNKKMGKAILLTFLTSYAGFLSVSASRIDTLIDFAIVASTGLLFNFIITVSLVPAILSITGPKNENENFREKISEWIHPYPHWLETHRYKTSIFMLLITIIFAFGIPSIKSDNNLLANFSRDSEIHQRFDSVENKLSGLESFSIVVDAGIQDTFLKIRYIEELKKIQDYLISTGYAKSTTSFADYLSLLNSAFQELDSLQLPESDEIITELMIFLKHEDVKSFVTSDFSQARIMVRHASMASTELKTFINELESFIAENLDPGLDARLTGDTVLGQSATESIVFGQFQSVIFMLLTIILIISVLFTDWKVGFIAAIPNFFPVVIMFGVMGYANIPLNIGTAMAAAIAIGIAVDDTLHFMLRYNRDLKIFKEQNLAMHNTIIEEARPVIATSLALIAGFLVFAYSDFAQIREFGFLSAIAIGSALLADFVITPLLLSTLHLITLWDLLSFHVRKDVLFQSPLFENMRPWQIKRFILSSQMLHFLPDGYIFKKGDEAENIYIVLDGKVAVASQEVDVEPELFGPGEIFGEIAVLANKTRQTDATASGYVTLLVLDKKGLNEATRFHPQLSSILFLNLATRVSKRALSTRHNPEGKK